MAELCFKVPGMKADGDGVKAITGLVRQIGGVSGVEIDPHTMWVVITGERIDTEAIRRAVRQAGYDAEL
jgi:copper chaperone CopZ